jgi:hypothetical protein
LVSFDKNNCKTYSVIISDPGSSLSNHKTLPCIFVKKLAKKKRRQYARDTSDSQYTGRSGEFYRTRDGSGGCGERRPYNDAD